MRQRGTTLIEMVFVLGIVALLMGITLWSYKTLLYRMTLDNEANKLKLYLSHAQNVARTYQIRQYWTVSGNSYTIADDQGTIMKKQSVPAKIHISGPPITFTPAMTPAGGGGTITLQLENRSRKIVIDPITGRVRLQ